MKKLYVFLLLSTFLIGCNDGPDPCEGYDPGSMQLGKVYATWSPPSNANNFDYIIQLSTNGMEYVDIASTKDTVYVFENGILDYCNTYKCRIYAIDSNGRSGPASLPSNSYSPKPGKIQEKKMTF